MRGKTKGDHERLIILAHQTAAMTGKLYTKGGLKPLEHYLKAAAKKPKAEGGAAVLAMMRRLEKKQRKE